MILYLETQLEDCYRIYRLHQVKQDMPFMSLEDFRNMFEELMGKVYEEEEEDGNTFWNYNNAWVYLTRWIYEHVVAVYKS